MVSMPESLLIADAFIDSPATGEMNAARISKDIATTISNDEILVTIFLFIDLSLPFCVLEAIYLIM